MISPLLRLAPCLPLFAALACDPEPEPSLEDRVFLSQTVTDGVGPRALVDGTQLRLQFFEHPRVSASAGCNTLSGEYSIDDGLFVTTDAAVTEIGCDSVLHDQDAWYFGFLESSPSIVVDGHTLVLDGDGVHIEYRDQEVATPDAELTGITWMVDTIIEGEIASHAEWPMPAILVFRTDGVVAVDTGCNRGHGTYSVSGAELTLEDVALEKKLCSDPLVSELEAAVTAVIDAPQPVTWEITVDRLSLRGDSVGLDLVASDG